MCCVWFISPVCVEIVKSMARLNHMCANRRWCRWYSVDRFLISRCESDLTPGGASRNPFIDVVLDNFIQRCICMGHIFINERSGFLRNREYLNITFKSLRLATSICIQIYICVIFMQANIHMQLL